MTVAYERAHEMKELRNLCLFHRLSHTTETHYWQEGQPEMIKTFFPLSLTPNMQGRLSDAHSL